VTVQRHAGLPYPDTALVAVNERQALKQETSIITNYVAGSRRRLPVPGHAG
jgi:hypothetical protein